MYVLLMLCRFLFRYFQGTAKERPAKIMSDKKFFVALAVVFISTAAFNAYRYVQSFYGGKDYQLQFPDNNTALKEFIMSHTVSVLNSSDSYMLAFSYLVYPAIVLVGTFCTVQCYRFQHNPENRINGRTKRMYSVLITGLAIEQAAEVVWYMVPYLAIVVIAPYRKKFVLFHITYRWFYAYPTFQMIFTLMFYRRYRVAAMAIWADVGAYINSASVSVMSSDNGSEG
ncbi:unnamed protein product [Bursaphelenchus xylophilus]|uniref:(pine wood nematode) hypothetical protein n=1 Tax=Bursaphelenchus xylophilus TaxID=6326 RepID=A0A1I7S644_BURXY|nr:unnamed protein product [Bursaphelenchus xylophilus]CAG9082280.1 unnamed protein product [Bursaphelenchus xylophilus]